MMPSYNNATTGYSADVQMQLILNGAVLNIAQLGPDFLLLRDPIDHSATEATIAMRVDASERRWQVCLPDGISANSERVVIARA